MLLTPQTLIDVWRMPGSWDSVSKPYSKLYR